MSIQDDLANVKTLRLRDGSEIFKLIDRTNNILYEKNEWIVTFVNWDGSIIKTETVLNGDNATPPSNPTRPSTNNYTYTFSGWSGSYTNVTSSRTITAQYTQNTRYYTVRWYDYNGSILQTKSVTYGSSTSYTGSTTPSRPATAQYTYTFSGWGTSTSNITSNTNVHPVFSQTLRTYTLTWQAGSGGSVAYGGSNHSYGTTPSTPPTTPNTGYSFDRWSPSIATVTGPATYTAIFEYTAKVATPTITNVWCEQKQSLPKQTKVMATVSNNDIQPANIYINGSSKGQVPAGQGRDFVVAEYQGVLNPDYNITAQARVSGRTNSDNTTKQGTLGICSLWD